MNRPDHILDYYRQKQRDVFSKIPGMTELLNSYPSSTGNMAEKYPDAAFALMTAGEILSGDREQNAISQEAYFAILQGKNIAAIRSRYQKSMERYLKEHSWDG